MSFITKDSGERKTFDSGMVRDTDSGKTKWHLVADGPLLQRWAELLTRGAVKYSEGNWMKAEGQAEYRRFKASAYRHFMQWYYDDTDEDHAAAVPFNINGAEYVKAKLGGGTKMPEPDLMPEHRSCCGTRFHETHYPDCPVYQAVESQEIAHARETQTRFNAAVEPDAFCVSTPDGDCISTDPRCMHRRHDAPTFNGIPIQWVPDLSQVSEYYGGTKPLDLDECGTTDGTTPLPEIRYNNVQSTIAVREGNVHPYNTSHWIVRGDTVTLYDSNTGEEQHSIVQAYELLNADHYVRCDATGAALPSPQVPVVTILAKDSSQQAIADSLQAALNHTIQKSPAEVMRNYIAEVTERLSLRLEQSLWDTPKLPIYMSRIGNAGDFDYAPGTLVETAWESEKPSLWSRFKAWLLEVRIAIADAIEPDRVCDCEDGEEL